MKPAPFDYLAPRSPAEALQALARLGDDAKVLAGGQSLMPMLNLRLARPAVVVDINGVTELDFVRESDGTLTVGALTRQRALERWAAGRAPLLAETLRWVAHPPIRNRGTVVGSVIHADPAAELPALLLCCDGAVVAHRAGGVRVIPASDLYLGPLTTSLGPDELVTEVRFTLPASDAGWGFAEVARRHGDFALVGVVAVVSCGKDGRVARARLGFFGTGGTPELSRAAEATLVGQPPTSGRVQEAARMAAAALSPDSDLHATGDYRRRVAEVLAVRTLTIALERCRRAP